MPENAETSCQAKSRRAVLILSVFSMKCFDFLQMELSPSKFH